MNRADFDKWFAQRSIQFLVLTPKGAAGLAADYLFAEINRLEAKLADYKAAVLGEVGSELAESIEIAATTPPERR